jgi:hypothetical protein
MAMAGPPGAPPPFAERLARLLSAHGTPATVVTGDGGSVVRLERWRLFEGATVAPEVFEAWNGLWEGLAAMEGLRLGVTARADLGDDAFEWRIRPSDVSS